MSTSRRAGPASVRRGSALLAVLWLSAALAAIAFSVSTTVRGETERVATTEEDVRAYYLAQGSIQRAILHMQWGTSRPADGEAPYFVTGQPSFSFQFPTGVVAVDLIPESSKIDLNQSKPEVLDRLLLVLGVPPERAEIITAAIVDWRTPRPPAQLTGFDQIYLSLQPSFRAAHASFQNVEELLNVQGMTPDLFYGAWSREVDPAGVSRLVPHTGLRDCVSPFGSNGRFDVNTVLPAVLAASGAPPDGIDALLERRAAGPILNPQELSGLAVSNRAMMNFLASGPHTMYTIRATARMRHPDGSLSDLKRTVSALVKLLPQGSEVPFHILRWYDRG